MGRKLLSMVEKTPRAEFKLRCQRQFCQFLFIIIITAMTIPSNPIYQTCEWWSDSLREDFLLYLTPEIVFI